ncbi:hypothetical protein F4813DRAFT_335968 [Daldinia decipiens]|uniref:uncharacterized protein n=1 Tax=Daldinia decipiens TaxID=326647 RepID=UPI0020C21737|nr:uncharacterized protein F4813DRAFT_335968 [Daldinia decipiens]KAI1659531.1 hypothetical protein F4813DRAFT_335968 [Daldinia decipiens]
MIKKADDPIGDTSERGLTSRTAIVTIIAVCSCLFGCLFVVARFLRNYIKIPKYLTFFFFWCTLDLPTGPTFFFYREDQKKKGKVRGSRVLLS